MKFLTTAIACLFTASLLAQNNNPPTPQWRPLFHFTPPKNWTNDPNGLIYINGEYQLYYQHNPYANEWGHMSWGHATSKDLVHWNHYPVAIPEVLAKDTTWIYSGSAVYDKNNTSGFCKKGGCLVAIYTGHQPNLQKESQFIAYSNDGGMSYTNYDKNPVIDIHYTDFRDPNVSWNEQLNKWLMVVAVTNEHKVRFYTSPNLKEWTMLGEFGGDKGLHEAGWECPSLIELPVDGNNNNKKWVLFVSSGGPKGGPFMQYFVGDFDDNNFKNSNAADTYQTFDYGDTYYAAIPYNDAPANKKIIVGWMVPLRTATYPWRGQMSIPRDLSLKTTPDGVRLFQQPSTIITDALLKAAGSKVLSKKDIILIHSTMELDESAEIFKENAYWIAADFEVGTATDFGFSLASGKAIINYNVANNELTITADTTQQQHKLTATVKPVNGKIKLQIMLDKSSLEVFANDGEKVFTTYVFPLVTDTKVFAFAKGGNAKITSLNVWDLSK